MKKIILSCSAIIVVAFALISCNSGSPKDVANTWLTDFYHMNYDDAKKVSTDDTKKMLDMFQQFTAMMPDSQKQQMKKVTITVKDVKETGDKAVATYTSSDAPKDQTLNLVKVNGKWMVQWSKNDQGGSDKGADNTPMPAGPDSAGAPAPTTDAAPAATAAPDTTKK